MLLSVETIDLNQQGNSPEISEVPQCKAFAGWSESTENITKDMEVYALWKDDHHIEILSFDDNIVEINCAVCGEKEEICPFDQIANSRKGDKNYVDCVDLNNDGAINGKDFVMLRKMFKK